MNNLEKYKKDLTRLVCDGEFLLLTMKFECSPAEKRSPTDKKIISQLPLFEDKYQSWYSESLVVIKQLLPDRLTDFISYYEIPKNRKEITKSTYVIADYLQKIQFKNLLDEIVVSKSFAISKFQQQLNILKAVQARFESSLFDIQQLVQADLFDDELAEYEKKSEVIKNTKRKKVEYFFWYMMLRISKVILIWIIGLK